MVKLYTRHPPQFDITKEVSHSLKNVDECLQTSYQWLFKMLPTDQVIWCWGDSEEYYVGHSHGKEEILWELEVPREEIISVINSGCWDCVIGGWNYIPAHLEWWYDLPDNQWEKNEEEWRKLNPMRGWDNIFHIQSEKDLESAQYLIPSPVKEEWVVNKFHYSNWDILDIFSGIERIGFDSVEEAKKYRDILLPVIKPWLIEEELKEDNGGGGGTSWYAKWDEEAMLKHYNLTEDDEGNIIRL